jgi:hypothetical protein
MGSPRNPMALKGFWTLCYESRNSSTSTESSPEGGSRECVLFENLVLRGTRKGGVARVALKLRLWQWLFSKFKSSQ